MERLLCTVPLLVLLGACGDDTTTSAGDEEVTIKYLRHDNPPYAEADDNFLADYMDANENITVDVTTVRYPTLTATLAADLSRDALDYDLIIVVPSWVCGFADNIMDVPEDVITLSEAQNTFFDAPLAGSVCNGKLKGLPTEFNLEYGGVVANVTKFREKFGRDPGNWDTWADFIQDASDLTEVDQDGVPRANGLDIDTGWPQPTKHIFLSLILQNGGKYWNGGGDAFDASKGHTFNFTSDEATAALTEMVKWIATDHVMYPEDLVPPMNTFVTSRLAAGSSDFGWEDTSRPLSLMGYAGTWALANVEGQLAEDNSDEYDFVTLPPMVGDEHVYIQNSGFSFVVPNTAEHPEEAWAVAKAMALSPEVMREWAATAGSLPALRVNGTPEAAADDPQLAKVQPLLDKGRWVGYIPSVGLETIEGIMVSNFFDAAKGNKTIDEALEDMETAANAELAKHID